VSHENLLAWIRGTVMDSVSGTPWEGVAVYVDGRRYKARTDEAGYYDLPYYWQTREIRVTFSNRRKSARADSGGRSMT